VIPAGARCGTHASVAAVDVCQRCGRFLCGDCVELVREEVYCSECAARMDVPASPAAKGALAITGAGYLAVALAFGLRSALLFLVLMIVPGPSSIAGFVLAAIEWRRIKAGKAPYRGRTPVIATLVLAPLLLLATLALLGFGVSRLLRVAG